MVRLKNSNGNTEQTYFHVHTSQTRQCEGRDRIIQFPFCRVQEDRGFWRVHVLAPARHQHPQPLVPRLLAQADWVRAPAARGEVLWPGGYQVIDGVNKYLLSPHPSSPDPNSRIRNQIGLNKAPFNNKETEFALHCFIHVAVLVSSESESWKQWRIRDNITRIFPAAMFPSSLPATLDNVDCNTCLHKYLYIYCK